MVAILYWLKQKKSGNDTITWWSLGHGMYVANCEFKCHAYGYCKEQLFWETNAPNMFNMYKDLLGHRQGNIS